MKLAEYMNLTLPQKSIVDKIQARQFIFKNGNDKRVLRALETLGHVEIKVFQLPKGEETLTSNQAYKVSLV